MRMIATESDLWQLSFRMRIERIEFEMMANEAVAESKS